MNRVVNELDLRLIGMSIFSRRLERRLTEQQRSEVKPTNILSRDFSETTLLATVREIFCRIFVGV